MPVQALIEDLDGVDPVGSRLRLTPRCAFIYSLLSEANVEEGTAAGSQIGTLISMGFADELGNAGYASSQFNNPAIFIFGLGNSGADHGSAFAGEFAVGRSISSWNQCGVEFNGTYSDERYGGWWFGSDEMLYKIVQFTLPDDGSDVTVSGLDLDGNNPDLVMLIRQISAGSAEDMVPALGVWTPTGQWFNGNYVPTTNAAGTGFSHDSITHHYDDGCAAVVNHDGGDVLVYELTPGADEFTLSSVSGTLPAEPISGDWLALAIWDPAGSFNAGTVASSGGVETISGVGAHDALLVSRTNRELGEEISEELPTGGDLVLPFAMYSIGSSDRFVPAYGFSGVEPERAVLALRFDEATGDGVFAFFDSGLAVLFTVVGGVDNTLDGAAAVLAEGDTLALICDGDDVEVTHNGSTILTGTQTDVTGSGRLFLAGDSFNDLRCGTIGAPPIISTFTGGDAVDINGDFQAATYFFGGGVNMSRAKNCAVGVGYTGVAPEDQASYYDAASFTDAELKVTLGPMVFYDQEHNVFSYFSSLWSGLVRHQARLMGGWPFPTTSGAVMPINHDHVADVSGTYPDGPFLEIDADRANGWGVTSTGWAGSVFSDAGNHQIGWLLGRVGPSSGAAPCGFPVAQFVPQIYRRL